MFASSPVAPPPKRKRVRQSTRNRKRALRVKVSHLKYNKDSLNSHWTLCAAELTSIFYLKICPLVQFSTSPKKNCTTLILDFFPGLSFLDLFHFLHNIFTIFNLMTVHTLMNYYLLAVHTSKSNNLIGLRKLFLLFYPYILLTGHYFQSNLLFFFYIKKERL